MNNNMPLNAAEESIINALEAKTVDIPSYEVLSSTRLSPGLASAVYDALEMADLVSNKHWLLLVFLKYSLCDPQIYGYWQNVWDVLEDIKLQYLDMKVLKMLLSESLKDTKISWFASEVLQNICEDMDNDTKEQAKAVWSEVGGDTKLENLISWNKDITSLLNGCKFASTLGFLHTNRFFEYIHSKNPVFRNLYQLESIASADIKELCLTFHKDGLLCVQIINNVMIIWVNDTTNYKINLSNLVKYSLTGPSTMKLVFKKLGYFNTIDYRLNNFVLDMEFKKVKLMDYFIKRLKQSQIQRPRTSLFNLPVIISPEKKKKMDLKPSLEQLSPSQYLLESPEKLVTERRVINLNPVKVSDYDISPLGSELYSYSRNTLVQVPLTQESTEPQKRNESRRAYEEVLSDTIEGVSESRFKTIFDEYKHIVTSVNDNTLRKTRSGKVLPLVETPKSDDAKDNTQEGSKEKAKPKKRRRLSDSEPEEELPAKSSSSSSGSFDQCRRRQIGTGAETFELRRSKGHEKTVSTRGNQEAGKYNQQTHLMGHSELEDTVSAVLDDFSVLEGNSSAADTSILTENKQQQDELSSFESTIMVRYQELRNDLQRGYKMLLDHHQQGIQELNRLLERKTGVLERQKDSGP